MATGTLATVASIGGITVNETIRKTGDHPNVYSGIALAAGKSASAWVKTDADTAACNLTAGHGYSSGKMDVFWTTAGVPKCRYDVDVTVSVNALALDGGAGDDFPESAVTDVVVTVVQQVNTAIDGDAAVMLVLHSTVAASVYFEDADGDSIAQFDLVADEPSTWHDTSGLTNPITGDPITVAFVSNGTTTAGVLTIMTLEDSTP